MINETLAEINDRPIEAKWLFVGTGIAITSWAVLPIACAEVCGSMDDARRRFIAKARKEYPGAKRYDCCVRRVPRTEVESIIDALREK